VHDIPEPVFHCLQFFLVVICFLSSMTYLVIAPKNRSFKKRLLAFASLLLSGIWLVLYLFCLAVLLFAMYFPHVD